MTFCVLVSSICMWSSTFWAEVREEYFSTGINRQSMELIEKAAFMLVLDEEEYKMVSVERARHEH